MTDVMFLGTTCCRPRLHFVRAQLCCHEHVQTSTVSALHRPGIFASCSQHAGQSAVLPQSSTIRLIVADRVAGQMLHQLWEHQCCKKCSECLHNWMCTRLTIQCWFMCMIHAWYLIRMATMYRKANGCRWMSAFVYCLWCIRVVLLQSGVQWLLCKCNYHKIA